MVNCEFTPVTVVPDFEIFLNFSKLSSPENYNYHFLPFWPLKCRQNWPWVVMSRDSLCRNSVKMIVFHQKDKNRIRKIEDLGPKPEMLSKKPMRIYPIWWFRFCKLVWTSLLQNFIPCQFDFTEEMAFMTVVETWINLPKFWKFEKIEKFWKVSKKNSDLRGSPIPPDLDQIGSNMNNVNLEQTKSYFNDSSFKSHTKSRIRFF